MACYRDSFTYFYVIYKQAAIELRICFNSNSRSFLFQKAARLKHFVQDRINKTLSYKTDDFDITAW
jgi:hypothetical protein